MSESKTCELCSAEFLKPKRLGAKLWEKRRFCSKACADESSKGPSVCSVKECGRRVLARGFCSAHYTRWLRGRDINTPFSKARVGEPLKFINEVALNCSNEECLIWPFRKRGTGHITFYIEGRHISLGRYVCIRAHGEPPTPKHVAAHSCGNGHLGCVNPRHLRWATVSENNADMWLHKTACVGERGPNAKLSEVQARLILSLGRNIDADEIAADFGVHRDTIIAVARGKTWKHLRAAAEWMEKGDE